MTLWNELHCYSQAFKSRILFFSYLNQKLALQRRLDFLKHEVGIQCYFQALRNEIPFFFFSLFILTYTHYTGTIFFFTTYYRKESKYVTLQNAIQCYFQTLRSEIIIIFILTQIPLRDDFFITYQLEVITRNLPLYSCLWKGTQCPSQAFSSKIIIIFIRT